MINRIRVYVIAGAALASLAFQAGSSWAQSHPSPETVKLFDTDAVGYPGLTQTGVEQAIIYPVGWGFPGLTAAGVRESLNNYKQHLELEKQGLQEAEAGGYEQVAERYREVIAGLEQHIAGLEAALANAPRDVDPLNPPTSPAAAMDTPEARAKITAAKQAAADALQKAADGQYDDVQTITGLLVQALQASRQLSLAGKDDEAKDLEKKANDTLTVFSTAFAANCKDQSFNPLFVSGLARQNQLSPSTESPVDMKSLERCKYRLLATNPGSSGWRHCGIGVGDWFYRDKDDEGKAEGKGEIQAPGADNKFSFGVIGPHADYKIEGRLEFRREENRMLPLGDTISIVVLRLFEHRDSASGRWGTGGTPVSIESFPRERDWTLISLNNNKPCDPSRDVWDY